LKKSNIIFQLPNKKYLKTVFQLLIVGYLVYQIGQIGLNDFLLSIPLNPLFYIIYIIIYISLPTIEYIIYAKKWNFIDKKLIRALFKKKVLNTDVVGYSGEVFLFIWAKENINKNKSSIIYFIKDNNILSALASGVVSITLLLYFILNGYINFDNIFLNNEKNYFLLSISLIIILIFISIYYKNYILHIRLLEGIWIFLLHSFRILIINILQIIQWHLVMPEIILSVWFTYSAVQIIISRIPFLPSLDALFVNIILEVSDLLMVSQDLVIGMLTVNIVFNRILNLSIYLYNYFIENKKYESIQ
tara:strand:+ start:2932 stop:3840 length:909 start_codon:yes stop_codon:yes gene_type:complete